MGEGAMRLGRVAGLGTMALAVFGLVGNAAAAGIKVPCDVAALTTAIADGNTAGVAVLKLAPNCIYEVTTPATASEAFPAITGDITLVGGKNTIVTRDPGAAAFRVFLVGSGGILRVKKLALKHGSAAALGGGVLVATGGTLELDKVTVSDNVASSGGGVAVSANATATVKNSAFFLNRTTGVGGGAFITSGALTITKSSFMNNAAPVNGGAINVQAGGTATVVKSAFTRNRSGSLGGAVSNLGALNVTRSTLRFNMGSSGGAIASGNTAIDLSGTTITDNVPDNCNPLNMIPGCVD